MSAGRAWSTLGEMKIALLGTDVEAGALAKAAVRLGHELVWCGDLTSEELSGELGNPPDLGEHWETLLDGEFVDGVILGRGNASSELRSQQLAQLAKNGIAVLTSFPLFDSLLTYYEIDMSRSESGALLRHFNPLAEQSQLVEQCSDWIGSGHPQLGAIEQVVWERPLAERTRERVLWHFARDVELLSLAAGRLNKLGALGSPDQSATYSGLSVQLLGKSEVPVRWQVGPVETNEQSKLNLIAEQGKLCIEFDEQGRAIRQTTSHRGQSESQAFESVDLATVAIERFLDATRRGTGEQSTWGRALQAMELADTIEISLRRGRMIEVHQQQLTEELAFKGTMSALGCGVLMVLPPLLLVLGWLAEKVGLPLWSYRSWPYLLLATFALFLAIQLIPKLLLPPRTGETSAGKRES